MLVFQGPREPVQCLAFVPGPDGGWLAAGHRGTLVLWPLAGGDRVEFPLAPAEQVQGTHGLEEIAVSPDGKGIAGRWYRDIYLWRRGRGGWIDAGTIPGGRTGLAWPGKDLLLISGIQADSGGWCYEIFLGHLDPPPGAAKPPLVTQPHPSGEVTTNHGRVAVSADARFLATAARE